MLCNIPFDEQGLLKEATVSKMEIVQTEGDRKVKQKQEFYNLDAVIAVGYFDELLERIHEIRVSKRR